MPQLLDHNGNPIDSQVFAEPQTLRAEVASLHREYARHPARGLTPAKLARILSDAELGSLIEQNELFEDMEERDAHLYAELAKRRNALLTLEWALLPPPNAGAAESALADALRGMVEAIPDFEDLLLDMMDAVGKGYACCEIDWNTDGRARVPASIALRPQAWFKLDAATRTQLRLRDNSADGAALWPFGWIVHTHKAKSGYLSRAGLHRVLAWPYLFKHYSVRDLAEFLEIYGLPIRVGKYPAGATEAEKATLLRAVANLGHNAAGIMPQGMALEFSKAADGTEGPFLAMVNWAERSMSKAILGSTLTTQEGATGTQALGTVHNEVRRDILRSDARQVAATLTRDLLYPLAALNLGVTDIRRVPRFAFEIEEIEDVKTWADSYPKLAAAGVDIPVSYVKRKMRIPEREGDEPILKGASAPALTGDRPVAQASALPEEPGATTTNAARGDCPVHSLKAGATPPRDALDEVIDAALADWRPQIEPAVETIVAAIDQAVAAGETAAQFRARMLELLPQLNSRKAAESIARAGFVARLAGEADVDLGAP